MPSTTPRYEIWRPGNGRTSRPEAWQAVTQLEAIAVMQAAFTKNLGHYAARHPDVAIDATAVWWRYLHEFSGCIDLGKVRVRVRPGGDHAAA